ncbi:phosphatase PAP2 family protein [Thermococcus waiotapuensis]|uniref:Phosphatase PAP2 family protein n=1 Tax=Thermococcus waiotapuensis TaxID=90909 RepID=A0AAE4NVW4_9EURY|nr:phosphatase PAP2 family protein [Thermococcus waiotapuensis]MDV3104545.1 phosphatase PAP2 family protein [Thermococcus waiotapuensis]
MKGAGLKGGLNSVAESLRDNNVLVRLDGFLILYFGWLLFTFLYPFINESRDVTSYLLRLPFTSRHFVVSTLELAKSILPFYYLMKAVYFMGFSSSIALTVFFVLIYWKDLSSADELMARYFLSYLLCGITYVFVHVHAPHDVYKLDVVSPSATYLTQAEFVLPSLHNTIAAVNVITLWNHREKIWGKVLIALNSLVPFSTIFLAHHWIYDAISGFMLASVIGKATEGHRIELPEILHRVDPARMQAITLAGFALGGSLLLIAIALPKP